VDYGGVGSSVEFKNVEGGSGGACVLNFRYANGSSGPRRCEIIVNGSVVGVVEFPPTKGWNKWLNDYIQTQCDPGSTNAIKVRASTRSGGPNMDAMEVVIGG